MLWNEVDFTKLHIELGRAGRRKFTYDGKPFRFQIPESRCVWGLSEYKSLSLEMDDEFVTWWGELEEYVDTPDPYSSSIRDGVLRIKIDEYSQIFNSDRELDVQERAEGDFQGCSVKCIMEVSGMYYFNGTYGLTCRIYQMLYVKLDECAFILPDPAS